MPSVVCVGEHASGVIYVLYGICVFYIRSNLAMPGLRAIYFVYTRMHMFVCRRVMRCM